MKNLNPYKLQVKETGETIDVLPAPEEKDHHWKVSHDSGYLYFKTKKEVKENLDRIYGSDVVEE